MAAPSTGYDYERCWPIAHGGLLSSDYTCRVHGSQMTRGGKCMTVRVLDDVRAERTRQFAAYGTNADLEDGMGPGVRWVPGLIGGATDVERYFREDYERYERAHGKPTWMHLVREEVGEAFAETDPSRLREELIQIAALCVSWVEKLDVRKAAGDEPPPVR